MASVAVVYTTRWLLIGSTSPLVVKVTATYHTTAIAGFTSVIVASCDPQNIMIILILFNIPKQKTINEIRYKIHSKRK
jgi:hypothetical protein